MVLYSELKKFKAYTQLGQEIGKISGLIADLSDWHVKNIIISPSILKKKVIYKLDDLQEVRENEKKIIFSGESPSEEPPDKSAMNAAIVEEELIDKEVISSDKHEVGKVYDFDIPLKLDSWPIWKILIKRGIKERRLRLGPGDFESFSDKIVLKMSMNDIEGKEKKK
jgi:sporulation protein YlmC with PRC-barrel domain